MTKLIYEEVTSTLGVSMIKRTDTDGKEWWIPMDKANSDYQAYLNKDKAEQSTPSVTSGD
jgi:hypothetical protein